MRRRWRWHVVAAATAVLVAVPLGLHLLPAGRSSISAAALLARIQSSGRVAYSGYAQSTSGLGLPVDSGDFSQINDVFGSTSQLRVWWRAADDWRVDSVDLTGENDIAQRGDSTWVWDYESNTATHTLASQAAAVRLPQAADLLPPNLARRLLGQAVPADVHRIANARIAGEQAAGLRLDVREAGATITHIDVWARPSDGLPLRVEVFSAGAAPVISTALLDLSTGAPAASTTAFTPARGAHVEEGRFGDLVAAIDQFGRSTPPPSVAGLSRRPDFRLGAVGVYGRGVTLVVAVPLNSRLAGEVVPALRKSPGVVENASGISGGSGALNLQLSPPTGFGARWLLAGTVTKKTLVAAVAALPPAEGFRFGR